MQRPFIVGAVSAWAATVPFAAAQPVVRGIRGNGDVVRIDPQTGAGSFVANCGVVCDGATGIVLGATRTERSELLVIGGGGATADQVTALNDWTAAVAQTYPTTGRPPGQFIRALAWGGDVLTVYVLLSAPGAAETLARIDLFTGQYSVIGPTGRSDLEAIAFRPGFNQPLYALGTDADGTLCTIDITAGAATPIGGGGYAGDDLSLAFLPDGRLLACGSNLRLVNPQTGAASLIGATGFNDVRGLTVIDVCYPDCTAVGPPPVLNVLDFLCFQTRFAAGNPYANCDQSTTPPVLNVNDYLCFMRRFVSADQDCR